MSLQTISQLILLIGLILAAAGGYGSYHFGKQEDENRERAANEKLAEIDKKLELIYTATKLSREHWKEVELKNVPGEVADYILLLFRSDKGRVSGKVRIKGSKEEYPFSTTANDRKPVVVRNLWLPKEGHYKTPTILEFLAMEQTEAGASFSIYTQGWIDTRGREPH